MADYAPPTGPPPPKVPEGWIAQWNDQYKEWFYVNKYTKKSQWDKPTEPIYPPPGGDPDVPPSYDHNTAQPVHPEKTGLSSNNPYGPGGPGGASSSHQDVSEDERLARQMQEEENARARGASDSYYGTQGGASTPGQYGQQQNYGSELPPRPDDESSRGKGKGFLGKLLSKHSGSKPQYGQQYPQQQQQQQYYQQGPPPGQYGGYPQQGYYAQPGYGPPQQAYSGRRPGGGGLGAGGAAALGLGGGLVGGMLLGEAIDGGDDGGDGGGDDGGGDFGGGDGGGDFGGGDF